MEGHRKIVSVCWPHLDGLTDLGMEVVLGYRSGLLELLSHVPWQQLIDLVDWMISYALKDVLEISLRIESAKLGCSDERIHAGGALTTAVGT